MSKRLIIGVAAAAIAAMVSSAAWAGSPRYDRWGNEHSNLLPTSDILMSVLAVGLAPNSEPVLRGPYYVLHAINPWGAEVRVVADAQFGDILSVLPAYSWRTDDARFGGVARIIHVPKDIYRNRDVRPLP